MAFPAGSARGRKWGWDGSSVVTNLAPIMASLRSGVRSARTSKFPLKRSAAIAIPFNFPSALTWIGSPAFFVSLIFASSEGAL